MDRTERKIKVFTVVEVWRGLAVSAKNFTRIADAKRYRERLRRKQNLIEDDVVVFEGVLLRA